MWFRYMCRNPKIRTDCYRSSEVFLFLKDYLLIPALYVVYVTRVFFTYHRIMKLKNYIVPCVLVYYSDLYVFVVNHTI